MSKSSSHPLSYEPSKLLSSSSSWCCFPFAFVIFTSRIEPSASIIRSLDCRLIRGSDRPISRLCSRIGPPKPPAAPKPSGSTPAAVVCGWWCSGGAATEASAFRQGGQQAGFEPGASRTPLNQNNRLLTFILQHADLGGVEGCGEGRDQNSVLISAPFNVNLLTSY
ncbi:hypothetical protein PRIPAC_79838 [Pristionchus pacificus]|uniref:Uncharacterized protein n=1 Tax=Pristionchus pacificus TaxID=54126 RepID=A0A2A6BW89_PRIPA|nr:hypothetical protein PRIPAC_79838 [Pristionchus pacificus]|eukprot:PDM70053.1 hypothetical protein PRIPAC_49265 [Pristionchus pacificus]